MQSAFIYAHVMFFPRRRFDIMARNGIWQAFQARTAAALAAEKSGNPLPPSSAVSSTKRPIPASEYGMVVGSVYCQFRRSLEFLDRYVITGRLVAWDDQNLYIHHTYESPPSYEADKTTLKKPIVYWIGIVRVRFVGLSPNDIIRDCGHTDPSPPLPSHWQSLLRISKEMKQNETTLLGTDPLDEILRDAATKALAETAPVARSKL